MAEQQREFKTSSKRDDEYEYTKLRTEETSSSSTYNVFRDSPVRYLGYANEIGESFRYQFPKLVTPSYMLSFGYCGMDAVSAGLRVWNNYSVDETKIDDKRRRHERSAIAALDTLLWQTFASVFIPGGTINVIVRASRFSMARISVLPLVVKKWFPTSMGIGSIPFIVHPIDHFVDVAMDNSARRWFYDLDR